jgi:hypothetical protein
VHAVALAALMLIPHTYGAADIYVTPDGVDSSGASWAESTSLTNALAIATPGEVIWVAEGAYTNTSTFSISTAALQIYGGFDGTETNITERDWVNHAVLLDGGASNCVVDIQADNVLLDGLIITNGYETAADGAGIRMNNSGTGLTMLNCRVVGNHHKFNQRYGGGAWFYNAGNVLVSNCVFQGNSSDLRCQGVGFASRGTTLTLLDSEVRANYSTGDQRAGKGFYLYDGTLTMVGCTIADQYMQDDDSGPGAGGYIRAGTASFTNCIFTGNDSRRSDGGGLYVQNGNVTIENCTFVENGGRTDDAAPEGGAIYQANGTVTIKNSIFWNNQTGNDGNDGDTIYQAAGTLNVSYSCMDGTVLPRVRFINGTWGDGIITSDPLFATNYTDLHLQSTVGRWDGTNWVTDAVNSSCIDAGDPASAYGNEPDGADGARINMGAYGNTWQASKSANDAPVVETLAARVVATAAEMRGALTSGASSMITFYYGVTDEGQTSANWDVTNVLSTAQGAGDVFTSVAGGLQANQEYWFTVYATNAFGEDWATPTNFVTGTAAPGGGAGVIHVDADAVGVPDGLSWTNAFTTVEDGLAAADAGLGTNMWIAEGNYQDTAMYVVQTNGLSIYGGFAGTETLLTARNWANNEVLLDGGATRSVLDIQADDVVLDGLTITNGYELSNHGVGVRMNNTGQNLTMVNCLVTRNRQQLSDGRGAGAYFNNAGNVLLSNCVFRGNYTTQRAYGLGFYTTGGTTLTVVDCEIRESVHTGDARRGAGFFVNDGTLTMRNTTVADNDTNANDNDGAGGGGYIWSGTASFTNCIFTGNDSGTSDGGGLYINTANVTIDSCTFADNGGDTASSNPEGGAIFQNGGTVTIKNSIFWNNETGNDANAGDTIYQNAGTLNVSYSLMDDTALPDVRFVSGSFDTGSIITNDPLFATEFSDLHLQSAVGRWNGTMFVTDASSSPAIDAGDPASHFSSEPADGNGARINLGAYGNTAEASKSANAAPVVTTLVARVVANAAELRGELTGGSDSRATFYYGLADQGATAAGWDATNVLSELASVSNVFSSVAGALQETQTYWFRVYATNAFGDDWGDALSLTTGPAAPGGGVGVIHVDADAVGAPDGLSWTNAFTAFEDALAAADAGLGTTIWVAEGMYQSLATFVIQTNGLAVYGGFSGTETNIAQRTRVSSPSLLDGGGAGGGVVDIQADNVVLDGLIITNGYELISHGAGVRMDNTGQDLTMLNCRVVGNTLTLNEGRGTGAYFNNAGNVLLSNCVIQANRALSRGNGIGFSSAGSTTLTLRDCEILDNYDTQGDQRRGKGFYLVSGTLIMVGCTVADNYTDSTDGNSGWGMGGYISSGTASFTNCVFTGNRSPNNTAADGGGLYINNGNVTVGNCTFTDNSCHTNSAGSEGGAIYMNNGSLTIKNSILWDNQAGNGSNAGDTIYQAAGTLEVSYSCMDGTELPRVRLNGGTLGDGIMTYNPLFATDYTDLHLKSTGGRWNGSSWVTDAVNSPCIDTGDPTSDFSREPMDYGGRINMGAYGNTAESSRSPDKKLLFIIR